ncbi:MAG: ABC transporter ATP-binding protein [Acetobacterales bacterium]
MSEVRIEARNVTRVLPAAVPVTLIAHVDLRVDAGEFVAITGPSGSGKSSLLYLLGLLDRPTEGEVLLEGRSTATLSSEKLAKLRLSTLGFVFQFHFLLPEFTALENVMIPMQRFGRLDDDVVRDRGKAILGELGLADHAHKRPDQLSGGQRQRVAIARALANEPDVVLADEPTGNLDTRSAMTVFEIFRSLARDHGKAVIAVTHDSELASLTDRRVHIVDGAIVGEARNAGVA